MHQSTQGIVIAVNKYNDRFSMAQVFTSHFGRSTYLLPISRSKKSKINRSIFFPLSIVDLEVEHYPLRQIHKLKEAQRLIPLYSINTHPVKTSIAFFLSEFLSKVLQETTENDIIFHFLENSVISLEQKERGLANFHIAFMFSLAQFLGITPNLDNYKKGVYFDLMNGRYTLSRPNHLHFLNPQQSEYLNTLKRINYNNMHRFALSQSDRNEIINTMLDYYRIHVYDFPEIKSLEVLRELF